MPVYRSTDPDLFERAPEQLVRAGETAAALELIAARWPSVSTTQGARLRALISELPEHAWADDPRILAAMGASYRSVDSTSRSAALPWFAAAEAKARDAHVPAVERAGILTHHSAALRSLGRLDAAAASADAALDLLDDAQTPPPHRIRAHTHAVLQAGLAAVHAGDWARAIELLRLALGLADGILVGSEVVECLSGLSIAAFFGGELEAAVGYADRAREVAAGSPLLASQFGAGALVAEALVAVERAQAGVARDRVSIALDAAHDSDWHPLALYTSARVSAMNGGHLDGLDFARRSLDTLSSWSGQTFLREHARVLRGELLLRLGEFRAAAATLASVSPSADHAVCPARFLAGIRLKAGDNDGCLAVLEECLDLGEVHSTVTVTEVHAFSAAAHLDNGNTSASDLAFDRALLAAACTTKRAAFMLVSPATLVRLLSRAADRNQPRRVEVVLESLASPGDGPSTGALEPLSDRERDIAAHLDLDKTVSQIAGELFISTNTVKTHVRSIYRKLSATNRKEAVRRFRELGMVTDAVKITPH